MLTEEEQSQQDTPGQPDEPVTPAGTHYPGEVVITPATPENSAGAIAGVKKRPRQESPGRRGGPRRKKSKAPGPRRGGRRTQPHRIRVYTEEGLAAIVTGKKFEQTAPGSLTVDGVKLEFRPIVKLTDETEIQLLNHNPG